MLAILISVTGVAVALLIFLVQEYRRRASARETLQWRARFDELEQQQRSATWELWGGAELVWRKVELLHTRLTRRAITGEPLDEPEITPEQVSADVGVLYGLAHANARFAILQIKSAEPDFSVPKIAEWRRGGKIANEYQEELFRKIMTDDSSGISGSPVGQ